MFCNKFCGFENFAARLTLTGESFYIQSSRLGGEIGIRTRLKI